MDLLFLFVKREGVGVDGCLAGQQQCIGDGIAALRSQ